MSTSKPYIQRIGDSVYDFFPVLFLQFFSKKICQLSFLTVLMFPKSTLQLRYYWAPKPHCLYPYLPLHTLQFHEVPELFTFKSLNKLFPPLSSPPEVWHGYVSGQKLFSFQARHFKFSKHPDRFMLNRTSVRLKMLHIFPFDIIVFIAIIMSSRFLTRIIYITQPMYIARFSHWILADRIQIYLRTKGIYPFV